MSLQLPVFTSLPSFAYTKSPNPHWKYGQGVEESAIGKEWKDSQRHGWKAVDTQKEDNAYIYRLMISGIIPRPIAFVSSISEDGIANLAPYSWFNMVTHPVILSCLPKFESINEVSANPPTVSISITRLSRDQGKDTAENIMATKTFTVNIISEPWVEQANFCCIDAPPGTSEWSGSGLTQEPSTLVKPARVKESAFSMECELFQAHELCPVGSDKPTMTLILGLVKLIHVRKDVLNEHETVDPAKFRVISRLGSITYGKIGGGFDLPREKWGEVGGEVERATTTQE